MLGALVDYVSGYSGKDFQPMNSNWGIVPPLENPPRDKREKVARYAQRALEDLSKLLADAGRQNETVIPYELVPPTQ
jgi:methylenetetrahydrofolate--tRNA-(uracil-5-)-methyltransferase